MQISSINGSSLMLVQTLLPKYNILHKTFHFTSKFCYNPLFTWNSRFYKRHILVLRNPALFLINSCQRTMSSGNPLLDSVEDVDIDDSGRFKYILIRIWPLNDEKTFKYIVRGYKWAGYHADVLERIEPVLNKMKIDCFCVGGGRIQHNPQDKSILVYGYSMGYGLADHSITVEKLKAKYPNYTSITFNNDGY